MHGCIEGYRKTAFFAARLRAAVVRHIVRGTGRPLVADDSMTNRVEMPSCGSTSQRPISGTRGWIAVAATLAVLVPGVAGSTVDQAFPADGDRGGRLELSALDRRAALIPPDRAEPHGKLAKGKFLVASHWLRDPNFSETVILLIDYNTNGAMGVIINRPTEETLSEYFPEFEALNARPDPVYFGGPVARNRMLLLIHSGSDLEDSGRVIDDIYVSMSMRALQQLVDDTQPDPRFRPYVGHAGWAPGQLDAEVSRGDWHIIRADADTIFETPPEDIWPALIRRATGRWTQRPR